MDRKAPFYAASICVLSVLVISYQISIIKALDFFSYSRFANLIISLALLGFGVSGTFLAFFQISSKQNYTVIISLLFLLLIITVPFTYLLAGIISLDIQYIFFSFFQFGRFLLYALCFFIPFFLCALLIGAALAVYRDTVYLLYGANLFGSGIGGILVLPLLQITPQQFLPLRLTLLALCAYGLWAAGEWEQISRRRLFGWTVSGIGIAVCLLSLFLRPEFKPDQYKTISYLERLRKQDSAELIWSAHGPRGILHLYASDSFHDALFASPLSPYTPPKQFMLLHDGEKAGTVFRTVDNSDAGILDYTPQSLSYRLYSSPVVLILGETGGTNILLARRFAADSITVVQENPNIHYLWEEVLPEYGIYQFSGRGLSLVQGYPRLYVKSQSGSFNIIHIASAEGMPAMQSGLYSAEENYLLTVEGLRDCLQRLTDDGCVTITMGLQTPPRDNIKIVAACAEALCQEGVEKPEEHILQSKNYLAATTLLFKKPVSENLKQQYLEKLEIMQMDSEWHPGLISGTILQRNNIPGPPGKTYSYLHHGAKQIFSEDRQSLYDSYIYNLVPPTDNKPYFHHFFRWKSLKVITKSHGANWFRSSEIGYLLLVATFGVISILSFIFIVLPLVVGSNSSLEPSGSGANRKAFWYLYPYPVIGLGFMFVELALVHRLGIFLGSPVYSIAAVITSMLVFSGIGSVLQGRWTQKPGWKVRIACVGVLVLLGIAIFIFRPFVNFLAGKGPIFRFTAALLFISPPAFFLGWFFSGSSEELVRQYTNAIPLAWGLNGFASVAAAPLATLLAMHFGFTAVLCIAAGLYFLAGTATVFWEDL